MKELKILRVMDNIIKQLKDINNSIELTFQNERSSNKNGEAFLFYHEKINKVIKACEIQKTKMSKTNLNVQRVIDMCCPHCGSENIIWYGLSEDCVCNECGKEGDISR